RDVLGARRHGRPDRHVLAPVGPEPPCGRADRARRHARGGEDGDRPGGGGPDDRAGAPRPVTADRRRAADHRGRVRGPRRHAARRHTRLADGPPPDRRMRLALVAAAAAVLAAGCGGPGKPAQSVAQVAPFETVAIAAGSIDNVYQVLHLIPAGDHVAGRLQRARGFIGGEYVPLLDEAGDRAVSLAPPAADQKRLERSLRRDPIPYARVKGWT